MLEWTSEKGVGGSEAAEVPTSEERVENLVEERIVSVAAARSGNASGALTNKGALYLWVDNSRRQF